MAAESKTGDPGARLPAAAAIKGRGAASSCVIGRFEKAIRHGEDNG